MRSRDTQADGGEVRHNLGAEPSAQQFSIVTWQLAGEVLVSGEPPAVPRLGIRADACEPGDEIRFRFVGVPGKVGPFMRQREGALGRSEERRGGEACSRDWS